MILFFPNVRIKPVLHQSFRARCQFFHHGQRRSSETRTPKMRSAFWFFLSVGAFFQCLNSTILPPNPCPKSFEYLNDTNGEFFGRITVENDYSGRLDLVVNMSVAAYLGREQNIKLQIESTEADIGAQRPLVYNISFPIQSVIPRLTRIELNKKEYCSGPPEELGPKGVSEMWAELHYIIKLRQRPSTVYPVYEPPVTFASPQLSTDFDNTTQPRSPLTVYPVYEPPVTFASPQLLTDFDNTTEPHSPPRASSQKRVSSSHVLE